VLNFLCVFISIFSALICSVFLLEEIIFSVRDFSTTTLYNT